MVKLGEIAGIDIFAEQKKQNAEINRIHMSLRTLIREMIGASGREYIYRHELEPVMSQEEKDFIGPFWKSKMEKGQRIEYTKVDSIDKMVKRKFYSSSPKWEKVEMNGLPKIAFLR